MAQCAAYLLWRGISSGLLSVLGLGIVITGMLIVATPLVLQQSKWLLYRRND